MAFSPLITQMIAQFCCLPGVGPKSAHRMVFHLLERARADGSALAKLSRKRLKKLEIANNAEV